MNPAIEASILAKARALKSPGLARCFRERARQAREAGWSYEEFLNEVLDEELQNRAINAAKERRRAAKFPVERTLDQFDFARQPQLDRDKLLRMARDLEWISNAQPVLFAGSVGTGKTHLATALGLAAAAKGIHVRFYRADDLVRQLTEAKSEAEVGRTMARLDRMRVLIVDELGFVPFDRTGAELLFNLLVKRYQRRSTIITTNLKFSDWVRVFRDERMTAALLDRLAENAHVFTTKGPSHRTGELTPVGGANS